MIPGEAAVVALCGLFEKLIDGQTPEQKKILWDGWIAFWAPLVKAISPQG